MPALALQAPLYGWVGTDYNGLLVPSGFTAMPPTYDELPVIHVTGLPPGVVFAPSTGLISVAPPRKIYGVPTEGGIFTVLARASSSYDYASAAFEQADAAQRIVIEGDGWLAFYHIDWTADHARTDVDLQFAVSTRTFASSAFDVEDGLELWLGGTTRIHPLISAAGCHSRLGVPNLLAVSDISLVVRLTDQFDSAPLVNLRGATGTEEMGLPGGTQVDVPYFDVAIESRRIERIFRALNAPSKADTAGAFIDARGQLAFTLNGRRELTPLFPVKLRQPIAR